MRTVASDNSSQGARGQIRPGTRSNAVRKSRLRGMMLEALETRELLSTTTLPTALISQGTQLQIAGTTASQSAPSVAIDPNNPQDLVAVWTSTVTIANNGGLQPANNGQTPVTVKGAYSVNGGTTWAALGGDLGNSILNFNTTQPGNTNGPGTNQFFTQVTDATVAFDAQHNFYVLDMAHQADYTAGQIQISKFTFAGGAPSQTFAHTAIYQWANANPAYQPTLAVDGNVASFTDPDNNAYIQTDPFVNNVYVAWSTNNNVSGNVGYNGLGTTGNPNTIKIVGSSDGGATFSTPKNVDSGAISNSLAKRDANIGPQRNSGPKMTISQGLPASPGVTGVPGGQVTVVWDDSGSLSTANPAVDQIMSSGITDGVAAQNFPSALAYDDANNNPLPVSIRDATAPVGTVHGSTTTTIDLPVSLAGGFLANDFTATIALLHNDIGELQIQLMAPNGTTVTLLNNKYNRDSAAANSNFGTTGANLGVSVVNNTPVASQLIGTTFSDSAPISLDNIPSNQTIGYYKPEIGTLAALLTAGAGNNDGIWKLIITDNRNESTLPTPAPSVRAFSLRFTSALTPGSNFDSTNKTGGITQIARSTLRAAAGAGTFTNGAFPYTIPASPDRGVASQPVIASDNTLGAYSPHQGRIYVAFTRDVLDSSNNLTTDTNIELDYSDDGGKSWTLATRKLNDDVATVDGYTGGNRSQFQPSIAVDQSTGTLVTMWYDARDDAANARPATYITASIDGGTSFSPQTFIDPQQTAIDAATGLTRVIGSVPANNSAGNANRDTTIGFSSHEALVAANGRVFPVWSTNLNGGGVTGLNGKQNQNIFTAVVNIAAGPRITDSDMGPVTRAFFTSDGTPYNTTFAPDGTRETDGFVVTFDRPVDPNTFVPAQVEVRFTSTTNVVTVLPVTAVTPVATATTQYGSTQFFIRFTPPAQLATPILNPVGTYSYSIAPTISDRIRQQSSSLTPTNPGVFTPFNSTVNNVLVPALTTQTSSRLIFGQPAGSLVYDVKVRVDISSSDVGSLILSLVAQDGTVIPLSVQRGTGDVDFTNTVFFDGAATPISAYNPANSAGPYRPDQGLRQLKGEAVNQVWTLVVRSTAGGPSSTINNWTLLIEQGTLAGATTFGNMMDQNANGTEAEIGPAAGRYDAYSVPTPNGGQPFTGPFSNDTLPLIVPGPHAVGTSVPGAPVTGDNLVLNGGVNALDVRFDRAMQVGTFTPASVLRVQGPAGVITPSTYAAQTLNTLGQAAAIPDNPATPLVKTLTIPTFGNTFSIANLAINFDITETQDSDLKLVLTGPDGTSVTLLNGVGGATGKNFTNTTLTDSAGTVLSAGAAPFTGSFLPQSPLSVFNGKQFEGTWTLTVTDTRTNGSSGTLNAWSLTATPNLTLTPAYNDPGVSPAAPKNVAPGATLSQVFNVPDNGNFRLADLRVRLDLAGQVIAGNPTTFNAQDLTVQLKSPAGTMITLLSGVGGANLTGTSQNFSNLLLSQFSPVSITSAGAVPPFTGAYQPQQSLFAFLGQKLQGSWTLIVTNNSTTNAVKLNSWSLEAKPQTTAANVQATTFRVGFPTQILSGTYTVQLGSGMLDANGNAIDTNQNAGLNILRGVSTTNQIQQLTYTSGIVTPVPDATVNGPSSAVSTISVPLDFQVANTLASQPGGVAVQVNISSKSDTDLTATLIAPDGTSIILFSGVGAAGNQTDFQNTILDDHGATSIQNGGPPFFGRFIPQQSLTNALVTNHPGGPIRTVVNGNGTWQLVLTDSNPNGIPATLNSWSLIFQKAIPDTGLGESVSDQIPASFRIFTMDPTNRLASSTWTAVGGASNNGGGNSSRIGGLAVDPSDPSGNTVFVGGASGGIWKTTNFLTNTGNGPTYIPLTDFGPTSGINIGGIAVFGRNNDPNQSIVFAATGEGDTASSGVGFLRSMDGGATWTLLDSLDNTLPFAQRDHTLVRNGGTTSFKIVVDPNPTPTGGVIVYAALSGNNGGIWRSVDSGDHWQNMFPTANGGQSQATDVVLDPTSGLGGPSGNLQIVYAAIKGVGVYMSPNRGQTWNPLPGGVGTPLIQDTSSPTGKNPVTVVNPTTSPFGAQGRIVLAKPALTGNTQQDLFYAGWLYAGVATPDSHFYGLFLTKDYGANWTSVRIPTLAPTGSPAVVTASPNNNINNPNYDLGGGPAGTGLPAQLDYDFSLGIDPTNPNITYMGGTADGQPTGFIRIDSTLIADAHALVPYSANRFDGGALQMSTNANAYPNSPDLIVDDATKASPTAYYNFLRDPNNPLGVNATLKVPNSKQFTNTGADVRWIPFDLGGTDQHRIVVTKDPLTGHARIIIGDDQGVFTGLDNNGTVDFGIGSAPFVAGARSGNLQITQFYYGAAQPSTAAAQIAGALFYAQAQDNGFPRSDPNVLTNGNIGWNGSTGDGNGVATDQQGLGTLYQYNWPCCGGNGTNFFQVNGIGRTSGLLQVSNPGPVPDPQWPSTGGVTFAVNPLNGQQIMISSIVSGRLWLTENQGVQWNVIGDPAPPVGGTASLDGAYVQAPAFGAPDPFGPGGIGNLDSFLYAGTTRGNVYVTQTGGGGGAGNQWTQINNGALAGNGAPLQVIITNPTRGSHEAYAVTSNGVYHIANSVTNAGQPNQSPTTTWVNSTGNLFQVIHTLFNNATQAKTVAANLTSIVADWRYVIPNAANDPVGPGTHPILYVGAQGGVFRSVDDGITWTYFPNISNDGSPTDGGYLPVSAVSDLDLSIGNIDVNTGRSIAKPGDPNLLLASTYGRGGFGIRLAPVIVTNAIAPGLTNLFPRLDPTLSNVAPTTRPDLTNLPVTGMAVDQITRDAHPYIDGYSEQSAFGNFVTINLLDLDDPRHPVVGVGFTDANGNFSHGTLVNPIAGVQISGDLFGIKGLLQGDRVQLGIQAVDSSGTASSIVPFNFIVDITPPTYQAANNDVYTTRLNTTLNSPLSVLGNDVSPSLPPGVQPITATLVTGPAHAAANGFTLNPDGTFTYVPALNFAGTDTFTYTESDGQNVSNVATVTINVIAPLRAGNDSYSTTASVTLNVPAASGLLSNDTGPNSLTLTPTVVTQPAHGVLTLSADGSFKYVPTAGYIGADSFTYTVANGTLTSNLATVNLTIAALPLVANNDAYATSQNVGISVPASSGILSNDAGTPGRTLTAVLVTPPTNAATFTLNPDGSFTYTPTVGYSGPDSFTYTFSNGVSSSNVATVNLSVSATPYILPVAEPDAYSTFVSAPLVVPVASGLIANDISPTTLPLSATIVAGPTRGVLNLNVNGSFTYTPTNGYTGNDFFTYKASDSLGNMSNNATVTLTIVGLQPTANSNAYSTAVNTALTVPAASGVLANDVSPTRLPLTATLNIGPAHAASFNLNPDGSFTYTPALGYTGTDFFNYTATDGTVTSAPALVTLTIPAALPIANADAYSTFENASLTVLAASGLLANDYSPLNVALAPSVVAQPLHGTLAVNPNGSFIYTPATGYTGPDRFTYTVFDGTSTSRPATVLLSISPTLAPVANADAYTIATNATLITIAATGVQANDVYSGAGALAAGGQTVKSTLVTGGAPLHAASFTLNADGSFTYVPTAGYSGFDFFTYQNTVNGLASQPTVVTLLITNTPFPVATDDTFATPVNTPLTLAAPGLLANDLSPSGLPMVPTVVTPPTHGIVSILPTGGFTYTPTPGYNGPDSFTYQNTVGASTSNLATVTLSVYSPTLPVPVLDPSTDSGRNAPSLANVPNDTNFNNSSPAKTPIFDLFTASAPIENISSVTLWRAPVTAAGIGKFIAVNTITTLTGGSVLTISDTNGGNGTIADGTYVYEIQVTDEAGNVSGFGPISQAIVIDATAPLAPTLQQLDASTDSAPPAATSGGPQAPNPTNDGYTNFNNATAPQAPSFDVTNIEAFATVQLYRYDSAGNRSANPVGVILNPYPYAILPTNVGAQVNHLVISDNLFGTIADSPLGNPLNSPPSASGQKPYYYAAVQVDTADNIGPPSAGGASPTPYTGGVAVTIDTTAPATPIVTGLDPASDTGTVGDRITTQNVAPLIDVGTVANPIEPNSTIFLYRAPSDDAGTPTGPSVLVSILFFATGGVDQVADLNQGIATPIPDGNYVYYAQVFDLAGNASAGGGPSPRVKIDTTTPLTPTLQRLDAGTDSAPPVATSGGPQATNPSGDAYTNFNDATAAQAPSFDVTNIQPYATVNLYRYTAAGVRSATPVGTITNPFSYAILPTNVAPQLSYLVISDNLLGTIADSPVGNPANTPTPGAGLFPYYYAIDQVSGAGISSPPTVVQANYTAGTPVLIDSTAPTAPVTVGLVSNAGNDTGVSPADSNSKVNTAPLVQIGNAGSPIEPNTTVILQRAPANPATGLPTGAFVTVANLFYTAGGALSVPDLNGGSLAAPVVIPDGTYVYRAQVIDLAGNLSVFGNDSAVVTIDTKAPATPPPPTLDPVDDSGVSNSDNITGFNNSTAALTPHFFVGTAAVPIEANGTITLLRMDLANVAAGFIPVNILSTGVGGVNLRIADLNGNPTPGAAPIPDGNYVYVIQEGDTAGNFTTTLPSQTITIDTTSPVAPPLTFTGLDTTSDSFPGVTYSGGSTTPALDPKTDRYTNFNNSSAAKAPVFDVTGVEAGATVSLYRNGVLVGTAVNTGTTATIVQLKDNLQGVIPDSPVGNPANSPPTVGTQSPYLYTVTETDLAGNTSLPTAGNPAVRVTIDATAPATAPAPGLDAGSDSGSSNSDGITNVNLAPKINVGSAASPLEPNTTVILLRATSDKLGNPTGAFAPVATLFYASGGVAQVPDLNGGTVAAPLGIPDGFYVYQAQLVDLAGNVNALSNRSRVVYIDTTAPTVPSALTLDVSTDSGPLPGQTNGDNYTNFNNGVNPAPIFDVSGVEPGATVTLYRYDSQGNRQIVGTAVNTGSTVATVQVRDNLKGTIPDSPIGSPADTAPTKPVPAGLKPYYYAALQTDLAGNSSLPSAGPPSLSPYTTGLPVIVDTVAPVAPPVILDPASDTGSSSSDSITQITKVQFPIFAVGNASSRVEPNATINLYRTTTPTPPQITDTPVAILSNAAPNAQGTVTFADRNSIPDGTYYYWTQAIDLAGNSGTIATTPLKVIYLTAQPAPPTAVSLDGSTGNLTSSMTPVIDVSGVLTNIDGSPMTVTLLRDGQAVPTQMIGTVSNGVVRLMDLGPVADGVHSYTAFQTDIAGNVSAHGPNFVLTISPGAPTGVTFHTGSDSGTPGDGITNVTNPSFDITGVTPGFTVRLMRGNTVVAAGVAQSTTITLQDLGPVQPDGIYLYTAVQVDQTSTSSPPSTAFQVTIVTSAPTPTVVLNPASDSSNGRPNVDGSIPTKVTNPTFDVSGVEVGATIQLFQGGNLVNSTVAAATTLMIQDPGPLSNGRYIYTVKQIDAAGNVSLASNPITLAVQTIVPPAPTLTLTSGGTRPVIQLGSIVVGDTVKLFRNGKAILTIVGATSTTINYTETTVLTGNPATTYIYTAFQFDSANNVSPTGTLPVTVDTTVPPGPSVTLNPNSGSVANGVGTATVTTNVGFNIGNVLPGATVTLSRSNNLGTSVVVASATVGGGNTVMITDPGPLTPNASYSYTAQQTNSAGIQGPVGAPFTVTVAPGAQGKSVVPDDFNGDGTSDVAVYGYGRLAVQLSGGALQTTTYGGPQDKFASGDFLGLGRTNIAVYGPDPTNSFQRLAILGPNGAQTIVSFGGLSDRFVSGDFFGDGKTDIAVYGPDPTNSFNRLAVMELGTNNSINVPFGGIQDQFVSGDFDGDGKTDIAVYGYGRLAVMFSGSGNVQFTPYGGPQDQFVAGDFLGLGKTNVAVYGPDSTNSFKRLAILNPNGSQTIVPFGGLADQFVVGDFFGTGRTDYATYGLDPTGSFHRVAALDPTATRGLNFAFGGLADVEVGQQTFAPPISANSIHAASVTSGLNFAASAATLSASSALPSSTFNLAPVSTATPTPTPTVQVASHRRRHVVQGHHRQTPQQHAHDAALAALSGGLTRHRGRSHGPTG